MRRFEHGGDVYAHADVVDFSANLNPLGMPGRVRDAVRSAVDGFDVYPDAECRQLVAAIARAEGVPERCVLACAGATDAMTRVCLALRPQRALVCAPCYSGYEQAIEQAGARVVRHALSAAEGFELTPALIDDMNRDIDVMFLANPNNPTGLTISRRLLERILQAAEGLDIVVVLDECFIDFTGERSATDLLGRFPNLVVVKAFTKTYAMAGLRLGYLLCADAQLMAAFAQMGQMWAVSTPAQVAGLAALREEGFVERTRTEVARLRAALARELRELGLRVIPGQANYLMFQSPVSLYDFLLERGILIRRCENYRGLDGSWFRVAVRTEAENGRLVAALKEALR